MLELLQAFSSRCSQIDAAIRAGDDQRVATLDSSFELLIGMIVKYHAANQLEAYMQLQFVIYLLEQDADDSASVSNHAAILLHLLDRYFGGVPAPQRLPPQEMPISKPKVYVPNVDNGNFLNSAILETLPDRVAVLTRDYRYLYSNPANCSYLGRKPIDMIGRHVLEFIGEERFRRAKPNFDACFAGQHIEYSYERSLEEGVKKMRCRMSPLRDNTGSVIGALIMMENAAVGAPIKA